MLWLAEVAIQGNGGDAFSAITQVSRSLLETDNGEHLTRSDAGRSSEHASEMPRAQLYQARNIRTAGATALLAIGDGPVFSYGADVAEMLTQPPEKALPIVADYMTVIAEIEAMPILTIAAVHGVCSSGGLEFALAFDKLWAAAGTKIGFLEPLIFIPPLAGGVQRIAARAGRSRALEVTTAGRLYEVEEFERWNIVNRVLPADTLRSEAETFAAKAAAGPTRAIEAVKIILRAWEGGGIEAADRITLSTVAGPFDSPEAKAAIRAYLARVREK